MITIQNIFDMLNEEMLKLQYLAEAEDKPGLSELLLDIADNITEIHNYLIDIDDKVEIDHILKKGGENAEEDGTNL